MSSYTKGELASAALEEIGIAEYEFDISPEQRQSAINRLDSMMADWNRRGLLLAYPMSKLEDSNPDSDSNIPNWAWEAVITNLAIRIAPSYGKAVSPETKVNAKNAYNTVCGEFAKPREQQLESIPLGAGYKSTDYRFSPEPVQEYLLDIEEEIDLSGGPA